MLMLGDIMWHEIGGCDDQIVPHPACEQGYKCAIQDDFHNNRRPDAVAAVRMSAGCKFAANDIIHRKEESGFPTLKDVKAAILEKDSLRNTPDVVSPALCDTDCIKKITGLASDDAKISGNCFKSSILDELLEDEAGLANVLANRSAATDGNSYCFPIGNISPSDCDLEFLGTEQEDKESSDLLYNEWPDIGNFEDVDHMLRCCDSIFGQRNASNDGEFSWVSSPSYDFDGFEHALSSGFKSSCVDSSAYKSYCQTDVPDSVGALITDSDKKNVPSIYKMSSRTLDADGSASLGHASYGNWPDATVEDKQESLYKEQAHEIDRGVEFKISPVTHISNENSGMVYSQGKQSKHQNQSEGKLKDRSLEYLDAGSFHGHDTIPHFTKLLNSMPIATQMLPSPAIAQHKQNFGADSFGHKHTYIPRAQTMHNHPSHQILVTPTSSIKSESHSHPCRQHQMLASLITDPQQEVLVGQAAFTDQIPVQKQQHQILNEFVGYSEVGESIELHVGLDSSTVQESSSMSSVLSAEISLEATSFQQLQYVMEQLDIRTKMCMRDSLYRLARNAKHRLTFGNLNDSSRDKSVLLALGGSDNCTRFMDIETDTNPIDRSMAHLLFYRPPDLSTMTANDVPSPVF